MKSKLVRDLIPAIIRDAGKYPVTHIAIGEEAKFVTIENMREEIGEFADDPSLEEAADIYEVFLSIINVAGHKLEDVIDVANDKRNKRGSFEKGILLK